MNVLRSYQAVAILAIILLLLMGCTASVPSAADPAVEMSLRVTPDPPTVGDAELTIMLVDGAGAPINDAVLYIQGDMGHAGMAPVIRDVEGGAEGVYRVPFAWSMGGDWNVTVLATLADGTEVERIFDLSVQTP